MTGLLIHSRLITVHAQPTTFKNPIHISKSEVADVIKVYLSCTRNVLCCVYQGGDRRIIPYSVDPLGCLSRDTKSDRSIRSFALPDLRCLKSSKLSSKPVLLTAGTNECPPRKAHLMPHHGVYAEPCGVLSVDQQAEALWDLVLDPS